jgi:hypothetical protein
MASILLSFVGNQDPLSDKPHINDLYQEGSIVTLVRHLLKQNGTLSHVLLLHTETTQQNAVDTREWLSDNFTTIEPESIHLLPVQLQFSQDPIDNLLALQEARLALEKAKSYQTKQDTLELNASSGTPAMKSTWSLLQAAGYAPHSHVWQVRNPKEQEKDQSRVFSSDVLFLKQEFDLKVVKQQIEDYNYSGALSTLKANGLETDLSTALLNYGRCRMAFDFNRAGAALEPVKATVDPRLIREISELRQRSLEALSRECYLSALTKLKNQEYAEFLTLLSSFQENILRTMIWRKLSIDLRKSQPWSALQQVDEGKLYRYLENCRQRLPEFINVPVMMDILEYYPDFSDIRPMLQEIKRYIDERNNLIHRLEGTSEIQDQEKLLSTLRQILQRVSAIPRENPFDYLNQQIFQLLDRAVH